jgi:AcrR family transcriptional regulator
MPEADRRPRADAERNRRRLLDAAAELFRERGLEVGVGEIAHLAGVGRGTLFRNFASKEDLIAAIVVDRMGEATARGRALLEAPDPGEGLFEFLAEVAGRQQVDRGLFEALADTWLTNEDIRAAHSDVVGVLDELLARAKQDGTVRADIGAVDVLMLLKGVCEVGATFAHINPRIVERQLDLVRAAMCAPTEQPLRGRAPTLADIEAAFPRADAPAAGARSA